MRISILFGLLAALPAGAQIFSFGIKGGVPLTSAYYLSQPDPLASSYTQPYIVGPTVELHLPFHFSVEGDALYRRNGSSITTASNPFFAEFARSAVNDWQFPILAKVENSWGPLKPFVDGGPVYRHTSMTENLNSAGLAVGAGLSIKLVFIRLSPEIRYTRWWNPPLSASNDIILSEKNQADLLVGITF